MSIKSVYLGHKFWAVLLTLSCLGGCESFNRSALQNSEGVACYTQGHYDQALPYFLEASRLDPNNSEALYNLASTYQQQAIQHNQPSLLVQAENYYRSCLDKQPSPETTICCYRGIATSMTRRNQATQAIELLKGWESRNPNSVDPKLELAYLYEAQGKNEEALKMLQSAVTLAPNDYRIYYKTGVVQQKLGNKSDALNQYLMAGRLQPSNHDVANRIAQLQSDPAVREAKATQLASNAKLGQNSSATPWQSQAGANISLTPPNFTEAEKRTAAITPPAAKPELAASPPISRIPTTSSVANTKPNNSPSTPVSPDPATTAASTAPKIPDGTGTTPAAVRATAPKSSAAVSVSTTPAASPPPASPPSAQTGQQAANTQTAQATQNTQNNTANTPPPGRGTSLRRSRVGIMGSGPPITRVGPAL